MLEGWDPDLLLTGGWAANRRRSSTGELSPGSGEGKKIPLLTSRRGSEGEAAPEKTAR